MVGACSRVRGGVVGPGQDPLHARLVGEGRGPGSAVLQTLVHALGPNIGLGGKQYTGHFVSEERMYRIIIDHKNKFALLWGEAQLCLPYVCL